MGQLCPTIEIPAGRYVIRAIRYRAVIRAGDQERGAMSPSPVTFRGGQYAYTSFTNNRHSLPRGY